LKFQMLRNLKCIQGGTATLIKKISCWNRFRKYKKQTQK
jgi:hypothetical protein